MNLLKRFLERKEVMLFLTNMGGEASYVIASNLIEPISDEDLAKKCNMRSADVRMILNKMHNLGIIDYNRSKDKNSGWYYYAWFLRGDKLFDAYLNKKIKDLENIEERLNNNEAYALYLCRKCEQTYDFDRAAELLYHCPICERILDRSIENDTNNLKKIATKIKKEIDDVKSKFGKLYDHKYKSIKVM